MLFRSSQLKEMFRRFEFRNLLNRVDELDEAVPASAREVEGVAVPWREGELVGSGGFAADAERAALATEHEVLVGPRPERLEFIARLQEAIPFYRARLMVPPGLTGWAQVNLPYGDSVEAARAKLEYDLYYVKHRSVIFDLAIVLRTLGIVARLGGH